MTGMKGLNKGFLMKTLTFYDPALCCSTGICGTEVDQELVNTSANVEWLKDHKVTVKRFNLSQQPMEFAGNPAVKTFLQISGADSLPLILLDDDIVLAGRYPDRTELARWLNLELEQTTEKGSCCVSSC